MVVARQDGAVRTKAEKPSSAARIDGRMRTLAQKNPVEDLEAYLLEDSSGHYTLEDGTGVYLLESAAGAGGFAFSQGVIF